MSYRREKLEKGLEYAQLGEESARKANMLRDSVNFLAWQALFQRKLGNELEAQRLYNTATTNIQWFGSPPNSYYYYALCNYHEAKAEYALALKLRQQRLEEALKGGSPHDEAWARYEVCRLLVKLHLPVQDEMALASAAILKLKDPKPLLKNLEALELRRVGGSRLLLMLSKAFNRLLDRAMHHEIKR